jgi:glucose-6-phosphate isomerase
MTPATLSEVGLRLPTDLREAVEAEIARAEREGWADRLWDRETSLWTSDEAVAELIADRHGGLDVPDDFRDRADVLAEGFALGVRSEGFVGAVVCGMGGSSLAPEVLARSFPLPDGGLRVRVLDSTDPQAVRAAQLAFDPAHTLYIVATKSGTTSETLSFLAHFWHVEDELHEDIPRAKMGQHFVAVTDPGRPLESIPHSDLIREVFLNPPDVGGRYSALTYVGLVPGSLMGLDLGRLLDDAALMAERCRQEARNPGLWLGAALSALARNGRDKLTFVIEPRIASFGAWAEQLIAESTGKNGLGVVPVDGEPLGGPDVYGPDRVFVRLAGPDDTSWLAATSAALDELAAAGHPVIDLLIPEGEGIGGEFFRWQFATAICGAGLRVNPFDEPNVTESKQNTNRVLEQFRRSGTLPSAEALVVETSLTLYGDVARRLTGEPASVVDELRAHLERARPNGYFGIHAYIAPTPERDAALRGIQQLLRDRTRRATTIGYGPRFLHSTGQLHKGGPPVGCFIQLVAGHPNDVPIHGARETFGTLIDAQALGDFHALEAHELPVLRVHLSDDPDAGLAALRSALEQALG